MPDTHRCMDILMTDALHYLNEYRTTQTAYIKAMADLDDNPPLTWDELREMEGKPVWVETKDEGNFWCVIDHYDQLDNHINHGEEFMLVDGGGWYYLEDMGTDWQAYRKERHVD